MSVLFRFRETSAKDLEKGTDRPPRSRPRSRRTIRFETWYQFPRQSRADGSVLPHPAEGDPDSGNPWRARSGACSQARRRDGPSTVIKSATRSRRCPKFYATQSYPNLGNREVTGRGPDLSRHRSAFPDGDVFATHRRSIPVARRQRRRGCLCGPPSRHRPRSTAQRHAGPAQASSPRAAYAQSRFGLVCTRGGRQYLPRPRSAHLLPPRSGRPTGTS